MKIKTKFLQMGGTAPAPEDQATAQGGGQQGGGQQGGGNPEEQLAQMATQIVDSLGPEAAAALAQMIMQMLQGAQGGAPAGQPTYQRRGGKLVMIGRR